MNLLCSEMAGRSSTGTTNKGMVRIRWWSCVVRGKMMKNIADIVL